MKAKRLRALLVAGLLSLAPAVTLTSCGGGGGGGGGGGDLTVDGWPSSLAGRTVTAQGGNEATAVFRFIDRENVQAEVTLLDDDEGVRQYKGTYRWRPDKDQVAYQFEGRLTRTNNTEGGVVPFRVGFSINPGRLVVTGVQLQYAGGRVIVFEEDECQVR